jgi:hypothetical protein
MRYHRVRGNARLPGRNAAGQSRKGRKEDVGFHAAGAVILTLDSDEAKAVSEWLESR